MNTATQRQAIKSTSKINHKQQNLWNVALLVIYPTWLGWKHTWYRTNMDKPWCYQTKCWIWVWYCKSINVCTVYIRYVWQKKTPVKNIRELYIYTYIHIHYNGTSLVIQQNIATSGCLWAAAHCCSGQGHKICMSGLKTLGEMPYVSTKSRCDPCLGSQRIGSNSIHESLLVSTLHKMRVMMSDVTFVTEMKIPSQKVGSMETYGNTNWIEFGTSVPASENSSHHLAQSTIVRVPVIRAEGKIYRALRRIWHGKSKYLKDPQKHHLSAGRELLQANLMRTCRERHRSHRWSGQFQATSGQQCLQYVAVVTCC